MLKILTLILFIIILFPGHCYGQETDAGPGFQMIMMNNPAFSGSEGDGVLRLSYLNYYPGKSLNLHTAYCSYDSYFSELHGGAGFFLSEDYQGGIVNDFRGGLSYAYFLQAGRDFFINAGLSASIYHRSFNFDKAVFPDQIDPLGGVSFPTSELISTTGHTIFDVGAGFLFIAGKVFGGISVNHLAEPDLSGTGYSNEKLKRKYLFHMAGDLTISEEKYLIIRPMVFMELQGEFLSAGSGAVLESKYLSFNAILLRDNGKNTNIQTGFSFSAGKISVYYNYRFNIGSNNNLMPISLIHQTGLAFSLYNVDKRNVIKTINFPKL